MKESFGLSGEYMIPCSDEWVSKIHPADRHIYDDEGNMELFAGFVDSIGCRYRTYSGILL